MLLLSTSRAGLIFLSGTLAFAGVACSSGRPTIDERDNAQPVATERAPSAAPAILASPPAPASLSDQDIKPDLSQPNRYELALALFHHSRQKKIRNCRIPRRLE
jgi:hypothetical protein